MGQFYDFLASSGRIDQSAVIQITGDSNIPLMSELCELCRTHPDTLAGLVEVIPTEGAMMHFAEVRRLRPPYLKALNDISQFLQNNGFAAASKFLDCSFEM